MAELDSRSGIDGSVAELVHLLSFFDPETDLDLALLRSGVPHWPRSLAQLIDSEPNLLQAIVHLREQGLLLVSRRGIRLTMQASHSPPSPTDDIHADLRNRAVQFLADNQDRTPWLRREHNRHEEIQNHTLAVVRKAHRALPRECALLLLHVATSFHARGDFARTLDAAALARTLFSTSSAPDNCDLARALGHVGRAQHALGNFAAARDSLQEALALDLAAVARNQRQIANDHFYLARAHRELAEFRTAEYHALACLAIRESISQQAEADELPLRAAAAARSAMSALSALAESAPKGEPADLFALEAVPGLADLIQLMITTEVDGLDDLVEHLAAAGRTAIGALPALLEVTGSSQAAGRVRSTDDASAADVASREDPYTDSAVDLIKAHSLLGRIYIDLGKPSNADESFRTASRMCEEELDEPTARLTRGRLTDNLGRLAREALDLVAAYNDLAYALRTNEADLGEGSAEVAKTLDDLARVCRDRGFYSEALEHLKRGIRIKAGVFGEHHPETARTRVNLGNMLRRQSRFVLAKTELEAAEQDLLVAHEGTDHPDLANVRRALGSLERNLGRADRAVALLEDALALTERVFADNPMHPEIAATLNNLAHARCATGDLASAAEDAERALAINYATYSDSELAPTGIQAGERPIVAVAGFSHPEIARSFTVLGQVQRQAGALEQSRESLELALRINRRHLGMIHPEVAKVMQMLGRTLKLLGPDAKTTDGFSAEQAFELAFAIRNLTTGDGHHETERARVDHAQILMARDRLDDARVELEHALSAQRSMYGGESREIAITLAILSDLEFRTGRLDDARRTKAEALRVKLSILDGNAEHREIAKTRLGFGRALLRAAREFGSGPDQFRELHTEAALELDTGRRILLDRYPEERLDIARASLDLAVALDAIGRYEGALETLRTSMSEFRRVFGVDDARTRHAQDLVDELEDRLRIGE